MCEKFQNTNLDYGLSSKKINPQDTKNWPSTYAAFSKWSYLTVAAVAPWTNRIKIELWMDKIFLSFAIWNFFEGRQLIRNCCHIPKWIRNLKRVFDLWLVMTHQSANENNAFIWKPNSCSFMTCTWPFPIRWKYSG